MAIINLRNGLEGQDYTAAMVREAGSASWNHEWAVRLAIAWPQVERAMGEQAREAVHTQVGSDVTIEDFLARYLEHPAATDVVLG